MNPIMTHIALHVADLTAEITFFQQYCGLVICQEREDHGKRIVWMSEPGKEKQFIVVLIPGGCGYKQESSDYSHLGFALDSREAVDQVSSTARQDDCLLWEPRDNPYPVGYYCGVTAPSGHVIEFSYGQPLGPGAPGRVDWEL